MSNILIAVKISEQLKTQIEAYIKEKYPEVKTVSQVVRAALKRFLEGVQNKNGSA